MFVCVTSIISSIVTIVLEAARALAALRTVGVGRDARALVRRAYYTILQYNII